MNVSIRVSEMCLGVRDSVSLVYLLQRLPLLIRDLTGYRQKIP